MRVLKPVNVAHPHSTVKKRLQFGFQFLRFYFFSCSFSYSFSLPLSLSLLLYSLAVVIAICCQKPAQNIIQTMCTNTMLYKRINQITCWLCITNFRLEAVSIDVPVASITFFCILLFLFFSAETFIWDALFHLQYISRL